MRIPRIYTVQPLAGSSRIILAPDASHHLSQVLRLRPGDELKLFDGSGGEYAGSISKLTKKTVTADIHGLLRREPDPPLEIELILGISRGERMEFALQKAVELGVNGIQPIFSSRCVVKLTGERLRQRLKHWRKIIISACEQSGRCRIPELLDPEKYTTTLARRGQGQVLLLDHRSRLTLKDLPVPSKALSVLVGPEGGLSEEERNLAVKQGFTAVRLGPRVMRTETAPLAAVAAIQILWGDFTH